jgi:hypothetical protein
MELKWRIVGNHYLLLSEICVSFMPDCFFRIFQSLHYFMTHRRFLIQATRTYNCPIPLSFRKQCILNCCVQTTDEFVKQACRVGGWSFPEENGIPYQMLPQCNNQVEIYLMEPYEKKNFVMIDWDFHFLLTQPHSPLPT